MGPNTPSSDRKVSTGGAPTGQITPREYEQFRQRILALTRMDLNQYKSQQLLRRLATIPRRFNIRDLGEYAEILARDPTELRRFRDWFTINVSEFFRDPARWAYLRERVVPSLLGQRRQLRLWSAGCSHGAEPYSLAMLLAGFPATGPHYLLATDIDPAALAQAQAGGPYSQNDVRNVSPTQLRRFFDQESAEQERWWVRPELRRTITFRQHDLLREAVESDFDLVVCRNVIIYFTDQAKRGVFERFHRALRPGGILFVGGTELITHARDLGFAYEGTSLYRRRTKDERR